MSDFFKMLYNPKLCMWLFRRPGYRGIISGKQILTRMRINGLTFFVSRKKIQQNKVYAALNCPQEAWILRNNFWQANSGKNENQ